MTFIELAKRRMSVRKFSDRLVEQDKLEQILEAGNIAPTAKNNQPQRIYVVQTPEVVKAISDVTPCVYGARTVLVFTYNIDEEWKNPMEPEIHSGVEDVSIVATHMMLEAAELGVDTIWVNLFPNSKLEEVLGLPKNERTVLIMPIGYRADNCPNSPNHNKRKALGEIVKNL